MHKEDINFLNNSFPIKIDAERCSFINGGEAESAVHEALEIKYFHSGASTLLIGSKTVRAEAGDIIIINPYEFHATIECGKDTEIGKYCLIMIGLDFFEGSQGADFDLRQQLFGKRSFFKTHIKNNIKMGEILKAVAEESTQNNEGSRLAIFGLMAQFFALLLRENEAQSENESSKENVLRYYSVIEPALKLIRDSYAKKFTVDELAAACRISKYHFCRSFKLAMGIGAIAYLNEHRIKVADVMLNGSDRSVGEVARECGFDDISYFSKLYKKHFGHSPSKTK
jgi:AraC-like DNA-binding protein